MTVFLTATGFDTHPAITHAFFGRSGGVSTGLYASLNCGLGTRDAPVNIAENRRRVADAMGARAEHLLSLKQIHSAECLYIEKLFTAENRPAADAMVTATPGLALGILTADCAPVLFAGETEGGKPVIAAAHAGWGGAFRGILAATVQTMLAHGAALETIRAVIGPCIGPESYEVGPEFRQTFMAATPENDNFFRPAARADHFLFNLPGYIENRLRESGLSTILATDADTFPENNGYFSYRRATHRAESDYGRQISSLVIR